MTTSNESGSLTTNDLLPLTLQIERTLFVNLAVLLSTPSLRSVQVANILDAAWKMLNLIDTAISGSGVGCVEKRWVITRDGSIQVPSGFWSQISVFEQVFGEIGCKCTTSDDGSVCTLNFAGSSFGSVLQAAEILIEHAVSLHRF